MSTQCSRNNVPSLCNVARNSLPHFDLLNLTKLAQLFPWLDPAASITSTVLHVNVSIGSEVLFCFPKGQTMLRENTVDVTVNQIRFSIDCFVCASTKMIRVVLNLFYVVTAEKCNQLRSIVQWREMALKCAALICQTIMIFGNENRSSVSSAFLCKGHCAICRSLLPQVSIRLALISCIKENSWKFGRK